MGQKRKLDDSIDKNESPQNFKRKTMDTSSYKNRQSFWSSYYRANGKHADDIKNDNGDSVLGQRMLRSVDLEKLEYAVGQVFRGIKTILKLAPTEETVEKIVNNRDSNPDMAELVKRSKTVLAVRLRKLYNEGKMELFDELLRSIELGDLYDLKQLETGTIKLDTLKLDVINLLPNIDSPIQYNGNEVESTDQLADIIQAHMFSTNSQMQLTDKFQSEENANTSANELENNKQITPSDDDTEKKDINTDISNIEDNSWPPKLPEIKDVKIRNLVFTHKSYVNDKVNLTNTEKVKLSNERLEFLGDSILNHLTTLIVYQRFPDVDEGILTITRSSIVNNKTLIQWAHLYGFEHRMRSALSLDQDHYNTKIYADLIESYIGGLFLEDKSYDRIQPWLYKLMEPLLQINVTKVPIAKGVQSSIERQAKNELYALIGCAKYTPTYKTISEENTDTGKLFEVGVYIEDECLGMGKGTNLKEAGLSAAEDALKNHELLEKYAALRRSTSKTESVIARSKNDATNSNVSKKKSSQSLSNNSNLEDVNNNKESVEGNEYENLNQIRQIDGAPKPLATQILDIQIDLNAKNIIYSVLAKYNLTPKYICIPINSSMKRMMITANDLILGIGEASTKKKGERKAAMNALNNKEMLEYLRTTYTSKN